MASFTHPARLGLRSLLAGALLALTLAAVAAGPAHAKPKEPNDGMCAKRGVAVDDEDWIFYNKGDFISENGHTFMCGGNDRWHVVVWRSTRTCATLPLVTDLANARSPRGRPIPPVDVEAACLDHAALLRRDTCPPRVRVLDRR